MWIKRYAMNCPRPGGIPPQRNVGAVAVSGQRSQIRGSRLSASNPQLAHPTDDPVQPHRRRWQASIQTRWFKPRPHCWLTCQHVILRSDIGNDIFRAEADYQFFLEKLQLALMAARA